MALGGWQKAPKPGGLSWQLYKVSRLYNVTTENETSILELDFELSPEQKFQMELYKRMIKELDEFDAKQELYDVTLHAYKMEIFIEKIFERHGVEEPDVLEPES